MNRTFPMPPRSPFATHLSGSARETELRIRNIFQWKRLRPPVWLMALVGAIILLCGSLVSCQWQAQDMSLPADTQHHGARETHMEAPVLTGSGEGATDGSEVLSQPEADDPPMPDGSAQAPGETVFPAGTDAAQALKAVLEGSASFYLAGGWNTTSEPEWYMLDQLNTFLFFGSPLAAAPQSFAIADLDGDGAPEAVVLPDQHSGPMLSLHFHDGRVYGYYEVIRGMSDLKADGTFSFSNSSAAGGIGRRLFPADPAVQAPPSWDTQVIAAMEEDGRYYLNSREVSQQDYADACARQDAKEDARWYSFTPEDIAAALG